MRDGRMRGMLTSQNQGEHPAHGLVENGLRKPAAADRVDDRAAVVHSVTGHVEVAAGGECGDAVMRRTPVGHHDAVEAPLIAQDAGEQFAVVGAEDAVDRVVGAHHGGRSRIADDALELAQIDLAQRPFIDDAVADEPVVLVRVRGEVLDRRGDAVRLDGGDERRTEGARNERVLGEVLEVAAAQRVALDVHAGREDHVNLEIDRLARDRLAHAGGIGGLPRARERDCRGEGRRRHVVGDAESATGGAHLADAVRTIGEIERGDAESLDCRGVPRLRAFEQARLLFVRQQGEQLIDLKSDRGLRCHRTLRMNIVRPPATSEPAAPARNSAV